MAGAPSTMAIRHDEILEQQLFAALRDHKPSMLGTVLGTYLLADADINAPDESGQTPIEAAFEWDCPAEMLRMLIESGADLGPVQDRIAWAAGSASPAVLQKFIDAGADVDQPGPEGAPLEAAARSGALGALQLLIAAGADLDAGGSGAPLREAIAHGHAACALALLAAGASTRSADTARPFLGLAAFKGIKVVVSVLLDSGADPNARTTLRKGPGLIDEVSSVFDNMFGEVAKAAGPDLPARDYADATPLIIAAGEGHPDVVRLLLERGADISATDAHGRSAYDVAQNRHQMSCVIALLDGGADPHVEVPREEDVLRAAEAGDLLKLREMIRAGVDLEVRDRAPASAGYTALMLAAAGGHATVITGLLGAGASPDAQSDEGWTALHFAAAGGHRKAAAALIGGGARIDPRTGEGETPLMLAVAGGCPELARDLVSAGADPTARDDSGRDVRSRVDPGEPAMQELFAAAGSGAACGDTATGKKAAKRAGRTTAKKKASKKATAKKATAKKKATEKKPAGKKAPAKKTARKKKGRTTAARRQKPVKKAAAKKTGARKTAKKKPGKKAAAKKPGRRKAGSRGR